MEKCPMPLVVADMCHYGLEMMNRIFGTETISPCIRTFQGGGQQIKIQVNNMTKLDECREKFETGELTVRKLTPRECWRLMDLCEIKSSQVFDDRAYDAASKVNSPSQLYKQAGNSICVGVLEALFETMFYGGEPEQKTLC